MSDTIFPNLDSTEDGQTPQEQVTVKNTSGQVHPTEIQSKDYQNIHLLTESRYGASRVFTAINNGRKVIIKALKETYMNDPKRRAALRKEYEITSQLDHKYIRKVIDLTTIQGLGECVIFEYIEGKTLNEHVRVGTLSEKQIKTVLTEVCDALYYMHRNQIVHCDLNPENILVTDADNKAKIIDIGLPETEYTTDKELLIKEMEFVAPELIKGEDCDPRSDIYSLGKIMEFINERNITRQFNSIATHCTQFSKEQRFDTISEVRTAITKGHPVVKTILLVLALCVLAALAFIYVPKIKENAEKEKAERLTVDFTHAIERIEAETPVLCEKYALKSLSEPIMADWTEDSLRYCQMLQPYFGIGDLQNAAMEVLQEQKASIQKHRQDDFEQLLLNTFKSAEDSLAVQLRSALTEPNDSLFMIEAFKWFGQRQ